MEIGTVVVAKPNAPYACTDKHAVCVYEGSSVVRIIARCGDFSIGSLYGVELKYFYPVDASFLARWMQENPLFNTAPDFFELVAPFANYKVEERGNRDTVIIFDEDNAFVIRSHDSDAIGHRVTSGAIRSGDDEEWHSVPGYDDIVAKANGKQNAPSIVMDDSKEFHLSKDELAALEAEEAKLLDEYGYGHTHVGLSAWNREWLKNKGWLLYWMSRHPQYVKGKYQIVFSSDYDRPFDRNGLDEFCNWARNQVKATPITSGYGPWSAADLEDMEYHISHGLYYAEQAKKYLPNMSFDFGGGLTADDMQREMENIQAVYKKWYENFYQDGRNIYRTSDVKLARNRKHWFTLFNDITSPFLGQEDADTLNSWASKCGVDLKARKGQKITKVAQRFCQAIGIDKVKDLRTDPVSGRTRDFGFNKHIAELGDAVNPLKLKRYTVLSANPIDYLTMSFGNSWTSCHTIDKANKRGSAKNGEDTYHGCYSSGTLSYMLDGASLIYYQVDGAESPENLELKDKMCREVFCLGHEKMIASRIYPYGRDNQGESETTSIQVQVRNVVEQIVSDMFGCDNIWLLRKGSDKCGAVTRTCGTHYADYTHYDDGVVCYLNKGNGVKDKKKIKIGHLPICPICGHEHNDSNWITCGGDFTDCDHCDEEIHTCSHCGAVIEDDASAVVDENGNWYCDAQCATEAGCRQCDDDVWYLHHVYRDREGNWFHDPDEEHIVAADGTVFRNSDDAYISGYVPDGDGIWHPVEQMWFSEESQHWTSA